jgi:prepilin-type N-terminal cleavage/methylation domain-containing protein
MYFSGGYKYQRAFGLVELMVSISIIALVSAIIVTRQSAFNGAVLLRNQAYEIAFTIRQAQQLAVSGGDAAQRRYGVYFNTDTANQHTYRLFADSDDDGFFDASEQIGQTGRLDSRFEIRDVSPGSSNQLAITFMRPNFDARFCANISGCNTPASFSNGPAYINVARVGETGNGTGQVRRVQVSATGQISVITY